jgi:hypothetical protein
MSWSLDWFAAAKAAKAGARVRRAGWTDQYIVWQKVYGGGHLYFMVTAGGSEVVTAADFRSDEFNARDWTDQPPNVDQCAAVANYNTSPVVYTPWTSDPIFLPPPPPGFIDPV